MATDPMTSEQGDERAACAPGSHQCADANCTTHWGDDLISKAYRSPTQPTGRDHDHAREVSDTAAVLAKSIHPDGLRADGSPSLMLAVACAAQEAIEDVIADSGDNSPGVLSSNIASRIAASIEAALPHPSPRPDAEVEHSRTCGVTRCGACEWEDEQDTPAPAPVDDREALTAAERLEWADWIETGTQAAGLPEPFTLDTVIRCLRSGRKPFGVAAGYVKGGQA